MDSHTFINKAPNHIPCSKNRNIVRTGKLIRSDCLNMSKLNDQRNESNLEPFSLKAEIKHTGIVKLAEHIYFGNILCLLCMMQAQPLTQQLMQ